MIELSELAARLPHTECSAPGDDGELPVTMATDNRTARDSTETGGSTNSGVRYEGKVFSQYYTHRELHISF